MLSRRIFVRPYGAPVESERIDFFVPETSNFFFVVVVEVVVVFIIILIMDNYCSENFFCGFDIA